MEAQWSQSPIWKPGWARVPQRRRWRSEKCWGLHGFLGDSSGPWSVLETLMGTDVVGDVAEMDAVVRGCECGEGLAVQLSSRGVWEAGTP